MALDFVSDGFADFVLSQGFRPLLSAKIATVSIDSFIFARQRIWPNTDIMLIGSGNLHSVNDFTLIIYFDMGF